MQNEQKLARLRPRAGRLILPTLLLGVVAGLLSFFENRTLEQWQSVALDVGASVVIFFGWMLPLVRQLFETVEVSTAGLVLRVGLFGQRKQRVSWSDAERVEFSRGRVRVFIHNQEPMVLRGLPKGKQLARELQNLVRG